MSKRMQGKIEGMKLFAVSLRVGQFNETYKCQNKNMLSKFSFN